MKRRDIEFIQNKIDEMAEQDLWPGEVAKKYGVLVGTLGCWNCGCSVSGAITESTCSACGVEYFGFLTNEANSKANQGD